MVGDWWCASGGHGVVSLGSSRSFEPTEDNDKKKRINTPKTTRISGPFWGADGGGLVVCVGRSWRCEPRQ